MWRILIAEKETAISKLLYNHLSGMGHRCVCVYDGAQALDLIERDSFDLLILGATLPQVDSYELMELIRPLKLPVIFVAAKSTAQDRVKGLRLGADDYITVPFQMDELVARAEAVMRRCGKEGRRTELLGISIDEEAREVYRGGEKVSLSVKEYDLLLYFIQNKNIALYRDRIYEQVWHEEFSWQTRTIDTTVRRLRKKLGWETYIQTVFRIGYKLEVPA